MMADGSCLSHYWYDPRIQELHLLILGSTAPPFQHVPTCSKGQSAARLLLTDRPVRSSMMASKKRAELRGTGWSSWFSGLGGSNCSHIQMVPDGSRWFQMVTDQGLRVSVWFSMFQYVSVNLGLSSLRI